jgi:hypothetical protein
VETILHSAFCSTEGVSETIFQQERYMAKPATRQSKPTTRTKPSASAKPARSARRASNLAVSHEDIALAAYFRAQERGFTPGAEMDDWLQAEQEIRAAGTGAGG